MKRTRIHLEQILSRRVLDPAGKYAGRIEEVLAERQGERWVVTEYLLGAGGLKERLSIVGAAAWLVDILGGHGNPTSHRVPWDQMDLSDPKRPRLKCPADALAKFEPRE
jgi:hypothetical protein